jgi:hypothetical protein
MAGQLGERMKFSIQEVLCVAACALFIAGQPVVGAIFLSLGVMGAIFRTAMEVQAKNEKVKAEEEALENVSNLGSQIGSILSAFANEIDEKTPKKYN